MRHRCSIWLRSVAGKICPAGCCGAGGLHPISPPPKRLTTTLLPATDDGTLGESGTVGSVLGRWLADGRPDAIVACGPIAMLRDIQSTVLAQNIPAWLSVEQYMACGVGACHGCVVTLANGDYARSCEDGPIFKASEITL